VIWNSLQWTLSHWKLSRETADPSGSPPGGEPIVIVETSTTEYIARPVAVTEGPVVGDLELLSVDTMTSEVDKPASVEVALESDAKPLSRETADPSRSPPSGEPIVIIETSTTDDIAHPVSVTEEPVVGDLELPSGDIVTSEGDKPTLLEETLESDTKPLSRETAGPYGSPHDRNKFSSDSALATTFVL